MHEGYANLKRQVHQVIVGQELVIPAGTLVETESDPPLPLIHTVRPGENLFRIGLRYNMTWDVIAWVNHLTNPHRIYVGQELVIPLR